MLLGLTGSLIGTGAVYLGSKGFSETGLTVWRRTILTGKAARIVGGALLILGVLLILFSVMRVICPCPDLPSGGEI